VLPIIVNRSASVNRLGQLSRHTIDYMHCSNRLHTFDAISPTPTQNKWNPEHVCARQALAFGGRERVWPRETKALFTRTADLDLYPGFDPDSVV